MRLKHIDILRGIAALMVVVFHLTESSGITRPSFDFGKYGWTGVQLFFVISGFVLPYSLYKTGYQIKNYGTFILKRIIRIYPAYIAAILINIILTLITGRQLIAGEAIAAHLLFLNDIIGLPGISPVFWTLAVEFQFYLLIALLYPYFLKSNARSILLILILSLLSFWIKQGWYIISWFPVFGLGILIFNRMFTHMPLKLFWPAVALLLFITVLNHGIPHAVAALFAVLFILYGNFKKQTAFHSIFLFLGAISYSLYLIHWDMGRAVVSVARRLPPPGNNDWLRVIFGLIFSIFCAWLLYITVEKRSVALSARIKYKT